MNSGSKSKIETPWSSNLTLQLHTSFQCNWSMRLTRVSLRTGLQLCPLGWLFSALIMVPRIEIQTQLPWSCCWTCRSSIYICISDEWLLEIQVSTKYRTCCKGLDDLGSEWSCLLSTPVIASFQIFSTVVSTDTHDYFVLTWVNNLRFMFTHC